MALTSEQEKELQELDELDRWHQSKSPDNKNWGDKLGETIDSALNVTNKGLMDYVVNPMAAIGQGMTESIPFSDEIQGGSQALLDVVSGDRGISELPQAYTERLKQFQDIAKQSQEANPILHGVGKVTGDVAGMLGTGVLGAAPKAVEGASKAAKALEYMKDMGMGASIGGLYGASESPANLVNDPKQVLEDTLGGAAMGGIVGGGVKAVGEGIGNMASFVGKKLGEFAEESPLARQAIIRPYQEAVKGVPFTKESFITDEGIHVAPNAAKELFEKIKDARNTLGQEVTNTLEKATTVGKKIDLQPIIADNAPELLDYINRNPMMVDNKAVKGIVERLAGQDKAISPLEAKELRDQLYSMATKLENGTGVEKSVGGFARKFAGQVKDIMVKEVPEFGVANSRYSNFMEKVPETVMRGDTPLVPGLKKASDMGNYNENLLSSLQSMIEGATSAGKGQDVGKASYSNLMKNIKELEGSEAARIASGDTAPEFLSKLGSSGELKKDIRDKSDFVNMMGLSRQVDPHPGAATTLKSLASGAGSSGSSMLISGGKHVGQTAGYLSKELYQKPQAELLDIARSWKGTNMQHYGENLERAIMNKNTALKNATIFTMLQNPDVRKKLNDHVEPEE